jgi:hypothetical protein
MSETGRVTVPGGQVPRFGSAGWPGTETRVFALCSLDEAHEGFLRGVVSCHGSTFELNLCANCMEDLYHGCTWCPDCGGWPILRGVRLITDADSTPAGTRSLPAPASAATRTRITTRSAESQSYGLQTT